MPANTTKVSRSVREVERPLPATAAKWVCVCVKVRAWIGLNVRHFRHGLADVDAVEWSIKVSLFALCHHSKLIASFRVDSLIQMRFKWTTPLLHARVTRWRAGSISVIEPLKRCNERESSENHRAASQLATLGCADWSERQQSDDSRAGCLVQCLVVHSGSLHCWAQTHWADWTVHPVHFSLRQH